MSSELIGELEVTNARVVTRAMSSIMSQLASCPLPITNYKQIVLAHGSGGKLSHQLIEKMVLPQFRNELLEPLHDGAIFSLNGERVAFSTDSFVVSPIFFPGGDIGKLAVHGTVNDLAMCGARPLYLSASFILEEGLPMEDFWRVVQSMHAAADDAGVKLVTGDTKVVDRGKADKIFINTSGIGVVPNEREHPSCTSARSAIKSLSAGQSPSMASRSCRCAKVWNLKPKLPATRHRCTNWWMR